jgi:O-antigen/teichoic acid export membrane protein
VKGPLHTAISLIRELRTRNSFLQNTAWLFSASLGNTLIQIAFFPILSRIYGPEAYGAFGLFSAITMNLAMIAGLSLSRAFVLPEKDEEFHALLQVSLRVCLVFSLGLTAITVLAGRSILAAFGAESLGSWIYLVGPVVFLMGIDRILVDWSIREKAFKQYATYSVPFTTGTKIFNFIYGKYIYASAAGLILTHLLTYLGRVLIYLRFILHRPYAAIRQQPSPGSLWKTITNYKEYPLFVTPGNFINGISSQLPVYLIPFFGLGMKEVGVFTFSLLLLDMPVRVLNSAIGPVFLQKSAEKNREGEEALQSICWRLYKNLLAVAAIPVLVLYIAGGPLYAFAFGEPWRDAGIVAGILSLGYFFRFAASPLSNVAGILRKEKELMYFQIALLVIRGSTLLLAWKIGKSFEGMMLYYSLGNIAAYFFLGLWTFRLLNFPLTRVVVISIASLGIVLFLGEAFDTFLF